MLTTNPFDDDKLREECGIFGVWGADNAASFVALGLHALQHRGQEGAGVTSLDGAHFHSHRAMGHVAGNFDRDEVMRALPGRTAIGHVRYSTTGETALRNVQPLTPNSPKAASLSPKRNLASQKSADAQPRARSFSHQRHRSLIHLVATSQCTTSNG